MIFTVICLLLEGMSELHNTCDYKSRFSSVFLLLFSFATLTVTSITDQVLRTALSLYMADCDVQKGLPLPSFEEILICNSYTTSEQVQ